MESLVVIAVIAVLIAILIPAIGGAMDRAKDAVCLSNHRQFGIAWAMYFADYDSFPAMDVGNYPARLFDCWGGVDWFGDDFQLSLATRPVNRYVAPHKQVRERAEVFMCPRDDSMRHSKTDDRIVWERVMGEHSWAEEEGTTIFSCLGSSYAANDWMYCTPGARQGWGHQWPSPTFRTDLGPDNVQVTPSRFILVSDWGSFYAGRYELQDRVDRNLIYGWWHGYEIGNMTFLDGSARRHEMGDVTTQDYTFYVDPGKQPPGSWKTVYQP